MILIECFFWLYDLLISYEVYSCILFILYTNFKNTNLSFASFKNATNYSIDPNQNFLRKTKFSIPEVIGLLDAFDIELD